MVIAVYNSPPGGAKSLPSGVDTKIVGIQVNTLNTQSPFWTVFGKVVVNNVTANPARLTAELTVPALPVPLLDTSLATIPAHGSVSVSLEGVVIRGETQTPLCVEIHCNATSSPPAINNAEYARLIAISVDSVIQQTC
jgi:hypothetical protein